MTEDRYYIKISPENILSDLVQVPYTASSFVITAITGNCCFVTTIPKGIGFVTGTTGYYVPMQKLLSGGTKGKRYIYPHGEVMIHQPSIGGAQGTSADLEILARQIAKTKELGAKILAENCGKTLEKVMKDFDRDYWMNATEAVEYGIVDGIVDKL